MSIDCTNVKLGSIAAVQSGVYMKNEPLGDVVCLQLSDLLSDAPEKIAMKVARTKRIDNLLLRCVRFGCASSGVDNALFD